MNKVELLAQQLTEKSIVNNTIAKDDYSADLAAAAFAAV